MVLVLAREWFGSLEVLGEAEYGFRIGERVVWVFVGLGGSRENGLNLGMSWKEHRE